MREKIPGLVPEARLKVFLNTPLFIDSRGFSKRANFSTVGARLAYENRGPLRTLVSIWRGEVFAGPASEGVNTLHQPSRREHESEENENV